MTLGTLDRTPPPFFRQGPSALSKLVFFSALALFLMVADARFQMVGPLRAALAVVLAPAQRTLAWTAELWADGAGYLRGLHRAQADERLARQALVALAEKTVRTDQLLRENQSLRALLELRPTLRVHALAAEITYEAADPFSRKVVIDRGQTHGLALGSPVINERGVLGQVTQLYPLTAEVTLLTDRDAAIPVLNIRTQQRSAAFGGGPQGGMELRYMSGTADVQVGDELRTSGLDGVYPPGLAVATVAAVERRAESGFARIGLQPAAPADGVRHVLVLQPLAAQLPPRPQPQAAEPGSRGERQLKTPKRGTSAPARDGREPAP